MHKWLYTRPDGSDEPIDPIPLENNIIQLGEYIFKEGRRRNRFKNGEDCPHKTITYCSESKRVWCVDCESTLDTFDCFERLLNQWDQNIHIINKRFEKVKAAEEHTLRSRAAKALDDIYRRRKMVPACPHCKRGLLADDWLTGHQYTVSKELEIRRREKDE